MIVRIAARTRSGIAAVTLAALATLVACGRAAADDPRVVAEWTHLLYGIARTERLSPPVAARFYAYATSALYFGLASADPARPRTADLFTDLPELPKAAERADGTVTAIVAVRTVLDSLLADGLPTTRSAVARFADSLLAVRRSAAPGEAREVASVALGRQVGLAIWSWSRRDRFDSTRGRPFAPPVGPGFWVNDNPASTYTTQNLSGASTLVTPDNPANAMRGGNVSDRGLILNNPKPPSRTLPAVNMAGATEPHWGDLRPIALPGADACPVAPLPPFSLARGSAWHEDARLVLETSRTLTPEQRAIAFFWADNAGETGTPAGHWLSIAGQLAGERRLGALEAARLAMLTSIALSDAFIASWRVKFRMNTIRPRAYIRATMDPAWEPLIPTPPFPEYVSGHSAVSAAAATTITGILGAAPFDDSTSVSLGHPVRRFASFMEAAEEAGQSRIYGGIHFPPGNLQGRALGVCVGNAVLARASATTSAGR